jgi:trimeric autotransporter adhesin
VGVIAGDSVTLIASGATGAFATADAGAVKTVTISGLTISGADAGNYTLTQPTTTAEIFGGLAINSGPTATPNPATVGAQVQLSCNTNLANSTYTWDFGDGTSDASGASTVNHAYATASTFRVTVTAKNGTQTVTASENIVINAAAGGGGGGGGATPPTPALPLSISKKMLKAKVPSVGSDTLTVSGSLTLKEGTTTLAATVNASAGSISNSFSLSTRGSAKSGSSSFTLRGKSKKGVLTSITVTFQVKLAGDFIAVLDKAGVPSGTSGSATIPLIITIEGVMYAAGVTSNGKMAKGN